ncbi:extracellular solute-binding protein [Paenibacillus silvae]|uniref:extracellular solute-binding protein n=1 Tax=Paenibacillus silvae TaxID=1325358 RepID=UPI0025A0CE57|nr:extracellular solute-binding protein [Paenibacillus silvae]MDM5277467.1 extracellular solute-binding protein [Paenibacillus silvae]
MKKITKILAPLVVTALLGGLLSACSSSSSSTEGASASSTDPVTLKVMLFGDKPVDMDKVLTEFGNRSKDTLNTTLDLEFNPASDHKQKTKLKLAAGEAVDLMFDAPWMNLNQNISQGFYQELDKYFNNDEYPGLKKAFSQEFLDANKVNGHLYAIPITNMYYDSEVVYIRKDLREKYGLDPIQSYDDLKVYLDKVKENEPEMIPFALMGDRGFFKMFGNEEPQTQVRSEPYAIAGTGTTFNLILSEDGKKVLGAPTLGDPEEEFAKYPTPFNSADYFYGNNDTKVEWNQYVQKDVLNEKDPGALFASGKSAANEGTINGFASMRDKLKTAVPEAELEFFVYNSKIRNMEKGAIGTEYKAWNYLVIPATSKNADRTMKFLDWLFGDQENHDLFELGIEGTHWTKSGEKEYKSTEQTKNYAFPGYELTWNPTMSRISGDNNEDAMKLITYQTQDETYYKLPLAGFVFNTEPVKTEIAKLQPKAATLDPILKSGLDANWRQSAAALNEELRNLGLEKVREELVKQAQAFLDQNES